MRSLATGSWLVPALAVLAPAVPWAAPTTIPPGTQYDTRITSNNRIAVTLSNYGVIGNSFYTRAASLEYPAGAGIEHLYRGGLWFGAHAVDGAGAFTGVVTGCLDAGVGPTSPQLTEFTPGGLSILMRSNLPSSGLYSPDAVSEEDFLATFTDTVATLAAGNSEIHRPMRIRVRQESYSWSWASVQDVLFLHFTIVNIGTQPLTDAWAGIYTEFASGNKNGYVNWPPSSADPGGLGFWYRRKWVQSEDSLQLVREHYCANGPAPDACQLQVAPHWIGLCCLGSRGAPQDPTARTLTLAGWNFRPGAVDRDQDVERYARMSSGTWETFTADSLQPHGIATGNPDPIELFCVGPFASIPAGDSIEVDFALVGGADEAEIHRHGIIARQVYDAGYGLIATPTLLSLAQVEPEPDRVRLVWRGAGAGLPATVERREAPGEWSAIAEVSADGLGSIEYQDVRVVAGHRYGYRLALREPTGVSYAGETWVDVPRPAALAILGVSPNPISGRDAEMRFTLAEAAPATLEVFDLAGRRVWARRFAGLAAGNHVAPLDGASGWAPGVYVLRLSQGARLSSARAVVAR